MASELKPWRYEIKYGPDGEDSYSWVYDDQGVMVAPMRTHKAKQIVDAMNTRPAHAATDTGLVTVAKQWKVTAKNWSGLKPEISEPFDERELVTRSQAEELLAAERAARDEIILRQAKAIEALGAKLAAAQKALEPFANAADGRKSKGVTGAVCFLQHYLLAARAVLGGKPS